MSTALTVRPQAREGAVVLRLGLTGGCGATETAGAISPLGEFRGLAAVGGDEDLLQHLPLHRLLDDRHVAEPTIDALDAIAGDENERNFPRRQHVSDRVDEFSAEIDVNDARIDVVVHGSDHGLGQPAEGSDDRKSEFGQNVLHHHGDQNLVFDQKHAVAGLELKRKRRPVLAHRPMGAGTMRQRFDAVAGGDIYVEEANEIAALPVGLAVQRVNVIQSADAAEIRGVIGPACSAAGHAVSNLPPPSAVLSWGAGSAGYECVVNSSVLAVV